MRDGSAINQPQNQCCNAHHNGTRREGDPAECAALDIIRFYCLSFSEPQSQAWQYALATSCCYFGEDAGPGMAVCLHRLLDAMRYSRRSCFNFSNPRCKVCREQLTEPEHRLLTLLQAVRRNKMSEAQTQALMLCEGNETRGLLEAAGSVSRALDQWAASIAQRPLLN